MIRDTKSYRPFGQQKPASQQSVRVRIWSGPNCAVRNNSHVTINGPIIRVSKWSMTGRRSLVLFQRVRNQGPIKISGLSPGPIRMLNQSSLSVEPRWFWIIMIRRSFFFVQGESFSQVNERVSESRNERITFVGFYTYQAHVRQHQ